MTRERWAWLVSVVLLAMLAFHVPGTLAQRDEDYAWIRTLIQVHRQVVDNFVDPVNDAQLKEKAIEGMLAELDDPFTNYIPPAREADFERMLGGSFPGVGINLQMQGGRVVVITPIDGSPAERAGVLAGDIITKVNGQSIVGQALDDVVKKVTGKLGTEVTLTVERDGTSMDFTMKRQEIVLPTVKGNTRNPDHSWNYFVADNPKVAYIRITQFDSTTFDELKAALLGKTAAGGNPGTPGLINSDMRGLILDLRFNPGGRLEQAVNICNMFLPKDEVIVTTRGRNRPEEIKRSNGEGKLPTFPIIVLVNDHSASAAEIVSGSLKDNNRALVVGQRTYGKGSVQEVMQLDDNSGELKLTVAHYYLPSGRLVQRKKDAADWGVEPQIIVPVDDKGEEAIENLMEDHDLIRGPATRPATMPTTRPIDMQLQQAINTMIGTIVLDADMKSSTRPAPTTMP